MKSRLNLLEGKESSIIIKLTLPMIYGLLSVIGVSLVDAYFIGKLGTTALAAFGFIFPVIFFINSVVMGISNGASAISARYYGSGDMAKVRRISTDAIMLGFFLTLLISIIGFFTINPVFKALGAPPEVLELIRDYMQVWYLGASLVVFPMIGNGAMIAVGNTRSSANVMVSVLVFNTLFDPIFMYGLGFIPGFGFRGGAYAALASRVFVVFYALWVLIKKEQIIEFRQPTIGEFINSWKEILHIGLPNALTNIILPVGFSIITRMVSQYGKEAVAALSVAERVEALSLTVSIAISAAMSPFIGQNLGARNFDRIKTGLRKSLQFSTYWGLFLLVFLLLFSENIILLFDDNPLVVSNFKLYFYFLPFSYPFFGYLFITGTMLNVFKKPLRSAFLTLTRIFFVYIPLAYLLSHFIGMAGIFLSAMLANILVAGLGLYMQRIELRIYSNS